MRDRCEATTTKKAWRNPLAPRARCEKAATVTMERGSVNMRVCALHVKKMEHRGWAAAPSPGSGEGAP